MDLQVTVDGSCTRYGRMGVGYVIRNLESEVVIETDHRTLDGRGTNNQAEYLAMITACKRVKELACKDAIGKVMIYTDSHILLQHLRNAHIRKTHLRKLYKELVPLLKTLRARVRWHSREAGDGPLADRLASLKYKKRDKEEHNGRSSNDNVDEGSQRRGDTSVPEEARVQTSRR